MQKLETYYFFDVSFKIYQVCTPKVNVANYDKYGLNVFLYILLGPNDIKKSNSLGLNVLKLKFWTSRHQCLDLEIF